MPNGAAFCGECGERTPRRSSLKGMLLDGRYRIEKKLAAGGFGAIYRATHVPSGSVVALKVLHADIASDPHLSARFRREAAALASLRDPHTVTTYDHGQAPDGTLFIAMELLTGRSLYDELVARGQMPWRRMLTIMRGVCSSLVEAHAHGIVHRDLKPANIHLEHRGSDHDFVKVLDFGIAKLLEGSDLEDGGDELTRIGQAIGTLEYMSPEQIVGSEIDGRSDLYTLGVVAYELITGQRPFADATGPTSLMTALMTRSVIPPSKLCPRDGLPPEVDRMLLRCLERDPQERVATAAELAAEIDAILSRSSAISMAAARVQASRPAIPVAPAMAAVAPAMAAAAPAMAAMAAAAAAPAMAAASAMAAVTAAPAVVAAAVPAPRPTLPGSIGAGPLRAPAKSVPKPRLVTPLPPAPVSFATLGSFDDADDDTTVDASPISDTGWEPEAEPLPPAPVLVPELPRSRRPSLNQPPDLTGYRASAKGSTVGPPPQLPPPSRLGRLKLVAWAMALAAGGVGLGVVVSTLT